MRQREAMTVRFPVGVMERAREVKAKGESLNDFVIEAVEQAIRQRSGLQAHETIIRVRAQVRARTGPHPDPVPLIRALRSGDERNG